jgi:phosphoribosylanthranilate isomerase
MTWIKICGITNLEDAVTAVAAGADALGFVFYEKSVRKIEPETAGEIVAKLPEDLKKVGVFVDDSVERIRDTAQQVGLSAVQVYLNQSDPQRVEDLLLLSEEEAGPKVIAVFPADGLGEESLTFMGTEKKKFYALMLDSGSSCKPGGTGKTFDWNRAALMIQSLSQTVPIIVAGGLTPLNVGEAIRLFQPWGVDVASGVEAKMGKKDPQKIRAFVNAVRKADNRN